jgi:uncharacterized protein YjbJ (UPF0337 family)
MRRGLRAMRVRVVLLFIVCSASGISMEIARRTVRRPSARVANAALRTSYSGRAFYTVTVAALLESRFVTRLSHCAQRDKPHGTRVANEVPYPGDTRPRFISMRSQHMNWDRIEGNWKQFSGKVKEQWGKLTDDDIDVIAGKRDQLVGKIQESYGIGKDEAEQQVDTWGNSFRDEDLRRYQ